MGTAYLYANHDQRQLYGVGVLGAGDRFSAIGLGLGARALGVLLSGVGTWKDHRIAVVADTSQEYEVISKAYVDISVEVVLLLIEIDGLDWLEERLAKSDICFEMIAAIAVEMKRKDLRALLDTLLGRGAWMKKYQDLVQRYQTAHWWIAMVQEARARGIRLLRSC